MIFKLIVRSSVIVTVLTVWTASLLAQHVEIYPNAGFVWPRHMANGQNFKDQAIWGVKGGVFLNPNVQIEGSFEYLNHFQLREPPNPFDPQGNTNTHEYTFTGALNGSTIAGKIAHRRIIGGAVAGTANFQVTLQ